MHLTQIQLRNWRSYRNATFTLPVPDKNGKRNVILIGAQNGVGKTSFLMALYLGLFGREAMHLIEGFRSRTGADERFPSYQRLIESILHRPSREIDEPHCSVTLTFEIDDAPVVINRRWLFKRGGKVRDLDSADGEEVLIEANGRKRLYPDWKDANRRVEELLFPSNVMPCLFFDGEQAQARVEAAGGRALFDAVKALYGTGLLDQLGDSLRSFIGNEKNKLTKDVGSVRAHELDEKRQELDRHKDQLKEIQEKLVEKRRERNSSEQSREQLENDLYSMVGDKATDIEEYSASMSALGQEENKLNQELVNGVVSLAMPLALSRNARGIVSDLEAEIVRNRWLLLKDEAADKASKIVESVLPSSGSAGVTPPLSASQSNQLRGALETALESLWSPPPEGCAPDFRYGFLTDADRSSVISSIQKGGYGAAANLGEIAVDLHRVTTKLEDTRQRFERTRDIQPQLQKLKADLQFALDQSRELTSVVSGLEHQERGLQSSINDLKGAIGQMEARREAGSPIEEKLDVAQRVRALVDDAKECLIPLCKDALEQQCTAHFASMISGEYTKFKTKFEPDNEPWLEGPRGQQVLLSSLSGAQKRAFGLAFTLAVAGVAQTNAPIVIDTPVGNMDSQYRSRVLQYVSEAAPGQVIFLSHDEEIDERYASTIRGRIRKEFLVTFEPIEDGSGVSTVNEDSYF
ncbi:AAA family ATPase [Paraburkholderia diazotrophica]|uniref:AAA family ATPase n=1 Tax=Paraburkholderia diazotrophica TaxID=667676 RepID=UPI00317CA8D8